MPILIMRRMLVLSMICLGLNACGGGNAASTSPTPAQGPPTTLTGNWLLAGSVVPAVYPMASTSIFITGNQVSGQTAFAVQCAGSGTVGIFNTVGFPLSGAIAQDGTFQASTGTVSSAGGGTFSLALTGNSPSAATPAVWTGTYSLLFTPGTPGPSCSFSQSANFAAAPIAPVTGTYLGVPVSPASTPFGVGAVVTLQMTQGAPILLNNSSGGYEYPITASLTITNSSCALSTTTSGAAISSFIGGYSFQLIFPTLGSGGGLNANLNDATAKMFAADLSSLARANGCITSPAQYTFTRQ